MTDLKSIEKQGKRVKELAKKIKEKSISLEELNEFSSVLADLNDKVAVLKYFYAKNDFQIKTTDLPVVDEAPIEESTPPIVEEIEAEKVIEPVEEVKEEAPEAQPSFSFSLFGSEEPEAATEEEKTESEPQQEEIIEKPKEVLEPKNIVEEKVEKEEEQIASNLEEAIKNRQSSTLNDSFLGQDDDSLGSKLKNTPITNLKSAIGINVKFTFINELFGGNANDFNQSVEAIDLMTSADDARSLLSELSEKNDWDLEAHSVTQFVEMVERRFM